MTECFPENVVVRRQHHVAILAGLCRADVVADPLFQLLPIIPRHDNTVHANGGNLDEAGLLRAGCGHGGRHVGVDKWPQMFRDIPRFTFFRGASGDGGTMAAGQNDDADLAGRFADFPLREEIPATNSAEAPRLAPHLDVENGK